ncbi:MAG: ribosome-associated GTPase EngA [Deltaproteobacteria bacterium]|nr:ribosome-associated GTPase EngA [Deltaproteobacteria bacterium]MCB9788132.1 ribosome-associated GTPase EngA [Deltaproteobacteria bacterium]
MPKPIVAIVGRPNVGKSTLFNRLCGRRHAVVQDMPGVTRDRHYAEAELMGRPVVVIDTGGFDPEAEEGMLPAMRAQAEIAVREADAVIAVYDGPDGLLHADETIARILARSGKPVFHVVNKIDGPRHEALSAEFWSLGVEELYSVSALHGPGVLDLAEAIAERLPPEGDDERDQRPLRATARVAVIGRPNVGKSTLVNRLLGEDRLLVSDVPGTTVDSIDTWLVRPPDAEAIARAQAAVDAAREALESAREGRRAAKAEAEAEAEAREWVESPDEDWSETPDEADDEVQVFYGRFDGGSAGGGGDVEDDEDAGDPDESPVEADDPRLADIDIEDSRWRAPEDIASLKETLRDAEEALLDARSEQRTMLIDTAGIRRRKWVKTPVERISIVRSFKSIDRAEVCLLVLDATTGVTDQDAKLAGLIQDKGRACVILVNKWDAVPNKDTWTAGQFVKEIRRDLQFISYAPIIFISALSGQRTHRILGTVDRVRQSYGRRIGTSSLNRWLSSVVRRNQPPSHKKKRLRIYYAQQVAVAPPTILLSVNDGKLLQMAYRRFLLNQLRVAYGFEGTPVRFVLRGRDRSRARR